MELARLGHAENLDAVSPYHSERRLPERGFQPYAPAHLVESYNDEASLRMTERTGSRQCLTLMDAKFVARTVKFSRSSSDI
jgi:hypothetical protein